MRHPHLLSTISHTVNYDSHFDLVFEAKDELLSRLNNNSMQNGICNPGPLTFDPDVFGSLI